MAGGIGQHTWLIDLIHTKRNHERTAHLSCRTETIPENYTILFHRISFPMLVIYAFQHLRYIIIIAICCFWLQLASTRTWVAGSKWGTWPEFRWPVDQVTVVWILALLGIFTIWFHLGYNFGSRIFGQAPRAMGNYLEQALAFCVLFIYSITEQRA